jgi:predicted HD phosphohydrolase
VWRPVGLHVAAKRYLCATSPGYFDQLSAASKKSLIDQGGVFTTDQAERFIAAPYAQDAVRLRTYDDAAKVPGARTPTLESYRELLDRLATSPP